MSIQPPKPFKKFDLPFGEYAWLPADVHLRLPETTTIAPELVHYLITIPWDKRYMRLVDPSYRYFFCRVLPYLHVRSTDVHVATCLPFADELIQSHPGEVDERVVHIAFILHDAGWSQMTAEEIADSLEVKGLALSAAAASPKRRHAQLGRDLAERILEEHELEPPLTKEQKETIYEAILYHDRPEDLAAMGDLPPAITIVCDVDHLWSFTHADFWQDTIRKGVDPPLYLEALDKDLDGYFVSEQAKRKARGMLEARASEADAWSDWTRRNHGGQGRTSEGSA